MASLTKSMVATVVLHLVDQGRLRLTDPVEAVLPGAVPGGERITVEQLLRHTSGLADYIAAPEFADPRQYAQRTYAPSQLVDLANQLGPVAEPRQRFSYSNTNYVLLGLIVERLSGRTLAEELAERVFRPAGMVHTALPGTAQIPDEQASGYYRDGELIEMTELNPSFWVSCCGLLMKSRSNIVGADDGTDQLGGPCTRPPRIWPCCNGCWTTATRPPGRTCAA